MHELWQRLDFPEKSKALAYAQIAGTSVIAATYAAFFVVYLLYMLPCVLATGRREYVPFAAVFACL